MKCMKKTAMLLAAVLTGTAVRFPVVPAITTAVYAAETVSAANPVISCGVPAYSGGGNAAYGNDDAYWTAWESSAPDYLAYDLSNVSESQRQKVIAVWYNDSTYDNIGAYVNKSEEPIDYTIEINQASGGSCPNDGWKTAETVQSNTLSSRQHLIEMNGANWIRIRVTKAENGKVKCNFDVHDASQGVQDSWIFFGDSITAGGMGNSWGTSYAAHINKLDSDFLPVAQNGGIGGISSPHGKAAIDGWLKDSPVKYVSIAYGTNDCWGNPNNTAAYYSNTKYMIDTVLKLGKVPVLPTIPSSTNKDVGSNVGYYNDKVRQLYSEYGDKLIHGPDFEAFFKENPGYLSSDGVHPSSDGYEAMRQLWAETMYANVYSKHSTDSPSEKTEKGDINADGNINADDVKLLQKYLLTSGSLTDAQADAADPDSSKKLNAVDLTLLKRMLLKDIPSVPDVSSGVYEAEDAALAGANSASADADASGGKAVGKFADNTDTVTFTIEVPADGTYKLILTAKGLGGSKINNVLADGEAVGTFENADTGYTDAVVRGVMLKAGKHEIKITKSWGWIMLDKLTVEKDAGITNDVYKVSDQLINPDADASAKQLFSYLCDSYGKYTLAGQVCDYGLDGAEFKAIHDVTGKYPAICGLDFMDYAPSRAARGAKGFSVDTALKIHDAGGIVTFCWHWNAPDKYLKDGNDANGNPRWWQGFSTANVTFDIDAVMNGRDKEGKALLDADIAAIAEQINILRDAGVPILWRPLHEASGGWFWWGAQGAAPYIQLWKYLYDQLTNVYGCSNLIWVWNGQAADWYPGDEYVDIIGVDIYADAHSYSAQNAKFAELLEYPKTNKITALTENGVVFDIDNVIASNARWAWFGTWNGEYVVNGSSYSEKYTEKAILKKVYDSEYVITLDELPDWD